MITTPSSHHWIRCFQPNPQASLRLFCFPYAGGSALSFRNWSNQLPATVEVCPIELPGRGLRMREKPFTQMLPLVRAIASSLLPHLDKPFVFFGHSMGGVVSFQLARLLRKDYGYSPSHLFVSGRRAPQLPDPDPPIHALSDAEFLEELRRLGGTPEAVLQNEELMQLLFPTLRADLAVVETYVYTPQPPLDCPITTFGGFQDPEVCCEVLDAWREQTHTAFSLHMFPGDHFFLYTAASQLLQSLNQVLMQLK